MADWMKGKRGLIMGVANDRSIAWGIAKAMAAEGADLAFSYQGDAFGKRVEPLAASLGSDFLVDVDVTDDTSLDAAFALLKARWGKIDFLVHAIAFSDKNELTGRFINTSRENFKNSLSISCFSFIDVARRASEIMPDGGAILTLTYFGGERVVSGYNLMGVCKAALDAAMKYLAYDLGPKKIRVNALSAGPVKTLAASAVGESDKLAGLYEAVSPLGRNIDREEVGKAGMFLLSDLASGITGEILHVDCGYNIMGSPGRAIDAAREGKA